MPQEMIRDVAVGAGVALGLQQLGVVESNVQLAVAGVAGAFLSNMIFSDRRPHFEQRINAPSADIRRAPPSRPSRARKGIPPFVGVLPF